MADTDAANALTALYLLRCSAPKGFAFSMAWFSPEDDSRLDFRLLQNGPVTLYFSREVLSEHIAWLRQHGCVVHEFDCSKWQSEDDFHTEMSRTLGFPDYYGRNLDAFNDCLGDVEVPEAGGLALVFLSFDRFFKISRDCSQFVLKIIAMNSWYSILTGRRLMAMVQSDDRRIQIEPVLTFPVMVNPAEFGHPKA